ncbi:MAG TPA: SGNH/GDSL hydrolase family protein [Polyangia bacterium]|nr:SGNH/GDSL hydrolase family protein [Polyangia bacterium]
MRVPLGVTVLAVLAVLTTDGLTLAGRAVAAVPHPAGPAHAGAPERAPAGDGLAQAIAHRDYWRKTRQKLLADDFGETAHYRKANAELPPPSDREPRVVFLGDSIFEGWYLPEPFPGKDYVGRGIGGQTTSQVLVRFRQDVVELRPAAVVILLGTNDLAGNTGPITLPDIQRNFASLVDLARARGIAVVLSSVLPVHDYTKASKLQFPLRPPAQIQALNNWLKTYCHDQGLVYLDFFSAMVDGAGLMKKELAEDGLHPNRAGYAIMAPLAAEAIKRALANHGASAVAGAR